MDQETTPSARRMTTAELIVKVLEVDRTDVWPQEFSPEELEFFVGMIRGKYEAYRKHKDFGTAQRQAQAETIEEIMNRGKIELRTPTYCRNCGHVSMKGDDDVPSKIDEIYRLAGGSEEYDRTLDQKSRS